jgi:hypothetical protein
LPSGFISDAAMLFTATLIRSKESFAESMEFTRNVALQFLQFCHVLQPLGPKRVGTKDDFLELYRDTEGTFQSEIREIVKTDGFSWDIGPQARPRKDVDNG